MKNKKNHNKPAKTEPSLMVGIIIVSIILFFGLIQVFKTSTPTTSPTKDNSQSKQIPNSQWNQIDQATAIFSTPIFLDRSKTIVYIPIKFKKSLETTWLNLDVNKDTKLTNTWLITHKTLDQANWSFVEKDGVYLYQKSPVYKTMADFLNNPPNQSQIMTDYAIRAINQYKNIRANKLEDEFDTDKINFVLTVHKIPETIGPSEFNFTQTLDASDGILSKDKNLTWTISNKNTSSENPYFLGNIHIDYQ